MIESRACLLRINDYCEIGKTEHMAEAIPLGRLMVVSFDLGQPPCQILICPTQ